MKDALFLLGWVVAWLLFAALDLLVLTLAVWATGHYLLGVW